MTIIKQIKFLRDNYIPEKLLFREEQQKDIKSKLLLGTGNILIHGDTGTGKTACVKKIAEEITDTLVVYVNCAHCNNFGSIVKECFRSIKGHEYNEKGKTTAQFSEDLKKLLKTKRKKKIVFIFDEIDKLVNKERDPQQVLGLIAENTYSNILLISNDTQALKNLDQRITSRLSAEKMYFRPYDASEIAAILEDRANKGLVENSWDYEALVALGGWVYKTSGDIRESLAIFYEMVNLAEKKKVRLTRELFEESKHKVEEMEFEEILRTLTTHQLIIISAIAKVSSEEIEGYAEARKTYEYYKLISGHNGESPVSERQVQRLIDKLVLRKLIQKATRSPKNRRGRLIVYIPEFPVKPFLEKYMEKYFDINDNTQGGGDKCVDEYFKNEGCLNK